MKKSENRVGEQVADYGIGNQREGTNRVETTVSAEDINLLKDIAKALRAGGSFAAELRLGIRSILPAEQAQTVEELLGFFQTSPLKEEDQHIFDCERDRYTERTADSK